MLAQQEKQRTIHWGIMSSGNMMRGQAMDSRPKTLSVVIPVYNAEKWLSVCVDSVLAATDDTAEIILINDGSKDGSKELIEGYERRYPDRIIAITKPNSGSGETRNYGIAKSTGKYICFIDSDDYVDKDYFEKFVSAIEETGADVVVGGYKRIVDGKLQFTMIPQDVPWARFQILAPWAKIFDLDFIKRNGLRFVPLVLGDDDHFATVAYSYANKVAILPYAGYNFICNKESITQTKHRGLRRDIELTDLLDRIDADVKQRDELLYLHYIKLGAYYMLHSGRQATKARFIEEHGKLMDWYRAHQVPLKFPMHGITSSEPLRIRLGVNVYLFCAKTHLMGVFAGIYCRGKQE